MLNKYIKNNHYKKQIKMKIEDKVLKDINAYWRQIPIYLKRLSTLPDISLEP